MPSVASLRRKVSVLAERLTRSSGQPTARQPMIFALTQKTNSEMGQSHPTRNPTHEQDSTLRNVGWFYCWQGKGALENRIERRRA